MGSSRGGLLGNVLLVESVTENEGKTTVVSWIASNLVEAGMRVLLVDYDFNRHSLAKLFNVDQQVGLANAINRIADHDLIAGSLKDYSIDDLFFLTSIHKLSGNLAVENEEQAFNVHFQNGVLLYIRNLNSPESSRIGTMLLNGGFITESQLSDALNRHQRTGQPLGYILVNAGYLGRDKLRGPLRLQTEEYIQKIFSWKKGRFNFKPHVAAIYENEKIIFDEDYTPMINKLGRFEGSKLIDKEVLSKIKSLEKDNLYVLPAGRSNTAIGSMNQAVVKKIFEKLRHQFDVVLVDTPPLDAATGVESIFSFADGIMLVIKAGHLSIKVINGAIDHMPEGKLIGAVINQAALKSKNYYY
jgi:Mrp family chromosome partitioning ATPase